MDVLGFGVWMDGEAKAGRKVERREGKREGEGRGREGQGQGKRKGIDRLGME